MSIIQVNHINSNCNARFSTLIEMSDVTTTDPDEREAHFLSRALAAFAIVARPKLMIYRQRNP